MAIYDNTYNPYGNTKFNTLKDYQTWMKQGLANKGINTPKFIPDNRMGPQTESAMRIVQGQGLISPQVQPTLPVTQPTQGLVKSNALDSWGNDMKNPIVGTGSTTNVAMSDFTPGSSIGANDVATVNWLRNNGRTEEASAYEKAMGLGATDNTNWIDGMSNYEAMQGITGGLGLAASLYSTFGSGGTMDVNKKNIELMNQQILNNREEMANRKGYRADIAKAFGPKTGLGV